MPLHPHRFIHAANLRLDVPVSVQTSESLTNELQSGFEDATIDAFEFVIDECIRCEVAYLLLSGNVFIESDRSLRARLALIRAFRRLDEHGIAVVVIPGMSDPAEAWRAIPELPPNVQICYSANPVPTEVRRGDDVIATVSASMWYGDPDAFGIRVIGRPGGDIEPFRIGTVSEHSHRESQRIAEIAQDNDEESFVVLDDASGTASEVNAVGDEDADDESFSLDVLEPLSESAEEEDEEDERGTGRTDHSRAWHAGFVRHCDEMLREGSLHYLALMDDLRRSVLRRGAVVVHCPGTTQPRSARESDRGLCTLVDVSAEGNILLQGIATSAVAWKQLEIHVDHTMTLSSLLQTMTTRLAALPVTPADGIWSVQWTLRGPLPVLRSLEEDDLDVAVAVELDVLDVDDGQLELLHEIRIVPDRWDPRDADRLARQYIDATESQVLLRGPHFPIQPASDSTLTSGWKQRLSSLLPPIDPERIRAQLRIDGATWFIDDVSALMPELLDQLAEQPEDIEADSDEFHPDSVPDVADLDETESLSTDSEVTDSEAVASADESEETAADDDETES